MRVTLHAIGMVFDADLEPGLIVKILGLADWQARGSLHPPRPQAESRIQPPARTGVSA